MVSEKQHRFQAEEDVKDFCMCGWHRDNPVHDHMPTYEQLHELMLAEIEWLKSAPANYASLRGRAIILERQLTEKQK